MIEKIKEFLKIKKEEPRDVSKHIDEMFDSFNQYVISIDFGEDILNYKDRLCDTLWDFRDELKSKTGFIFPAVRMVSNSDLQENEFRVKIRDTIAFDEFVIPNEEKCLEEFKKILQSIYENYLTEIFTNEYAEKYINFVQKENAWLVWNLSGTLTSSEIKIILEDLLKKGKSLNDISYIFEKIGESIFIDRKYEGNINLHKLSDGIAKLL